MDSNGDVRHGGECDKAHAIHKSTSRVFLITRSLVFVEDDMAALSSLSSHLPSSSSYHERQDLQKSRWGLLNPYSWRSVQ